MVSCSQGNKTRFNFNRVGKKAGRMKCEGGERELAEAGSGNAHRTMVVQERESKTNQNKTKTKMMNETGEGGERGLVELFSSSAVREQSTGMSAGERRDEREWRGRGVRRGEVR